MKDSRDKSRNRVAVVLSGTNVDRDAFLRVLKKDS
jgi:hypothetical protein